MNTRNAWVLAVSLIVKSLQITSFAQSHPLGEYRGFALGHDGDVARGKVLFSTDTRVACAKCHSVDGSSSKAGPDLLTVGDKFPRNELIRSILEPSASIAVGYGTTIVETKSGESFQGILKSASAQELELADATGNRVHIALAEIKEQRGSTLSLMPEGLQSGLTKQEFTDLIEYLVSLREPASLTSKQLGAPSVIPELATPVRIQPFLSDTLKFPHTAVLQPGDIRSGLVWFGAIPGLTNVFLAVHQTGKIWRIEKNGSNESKTLFADIANAIFNERGPNGLLGIAFHPQFATNRRYFLKHQVFEEGKIATTVVERAASKEGQQDAGKLSRRLIKIVSSTQDHSGGCIAFGPDGYLYIGMGDTGPQQDPQGHGQDLGTHLGKILRIDVDHAANGQVYAIPSDNPFKDDPKALPEVWAYGFREPWRFSFDPLTGDLWVGDVGQDRVEEVAIVRRGENHGWNVFEGFEPFSNRYRKEAARYTPPIFAYRRKFGNSITGGFVYRANKQSSFYGAYICGDYTSRRIWALKQDQGTLKAIRQIGIAPQSIASFGLDHDGELYVVGYEGMVYKLDLSNSDFNKLAPQSTQTSSTR